MKIGFFGTPEMAAYYMERLAQSHSIAFAVTGEDKPRGRHGTPAAGPVKILAQEYNIPVLQPENLLDEDFLKEISGYNTDIFVVVAYAKKIPHQIFKNPPLGMINVHPSLLPKYRGAAPMQWTLINGENETGVSIQYIDKGWDTGDILAHRKIPLDIDMTYEDLYKIVLPTGFDLLQEVIDQLKAGNAKPVKQNDAEATYCGKIDRNTSHINWNKSSIEIHNLVRGLNPKPAAWTEFKGKNIKIYKTRLISDYKGQDPGPGYLGKYDKRLIAGTGNRPLEILLLQPESKKTMDGGSFINGYRIVQGDFFTTG